MSLEKVNSLKKE